MKTLGQWVIGVLLVTIGLLAGGCSQLGLQKASTLQQDVAYSYSVVSAVRESAAQAVAAGVLPVAQAQKVLEVTDAARSTLDTATTALAASNTPAAQSALLKARELITQAKAILAKWKGGV